MSVVIVSWCDSWCSANTHQFRWQIGEWAGHSTWVHILWLSEFVRLVRLNDIALCAHTSELQDITCYMGTHSVTCHPIQVNAPCLTPASNPSQKGWYSINLPQSDGRLSWPRWPVTYWDGLPTRRRSPIQVLTGHDVEQLRWWRPTCYH